jgi:hypothetical protein
VARHAGRHAPWCPQSNSRLEPRRIEQADEQKRKHDEQQHDPGEEHDDAEQAAGVGRECHVAEAQRRHHDQRPVRAGDPRVALAFEVQLDDVEQHRVEEDEPGKERDVLQQGSDVGARFRVLHEVRELAGKEFHAGAVMVTRPPVTFP